MKNLLRTTCVCLAAIISTAAHADSDVPVFVKYDFSDYGIVTVMSDNGQWGLSTFGVSDNEYSDQTKLVDITTGEYTTIRTDDDVTAGYTASANDVTDDGEIVVGSYNGVPAYWTKSTLTWTTVELPSENSSATITAVTPDGKYGVGQGDFSESLFYSSGIMWDLETGTVIDLPNIPTLDMTHEEQNQMRFLDVSPDGRYVVAEMSYSYVYPASICVFVYDRDNDSVAYVGFTASDTNDWTPDVDDLYFCSDPWMSPNGEWIAINAYMVTDDTEYYVPARYNVESGELTVYNDTESQGMGTFCIDNDGNVLGVTSYQSTPLREWYVRYGEYWYSFELILSENYDIDYYDYTSYDYTGSPMAISEDGKTILVMVDPNGESYAVQLPKTPTELCDTINLLATYSVEPEDGSIFAYVNIVEVTFDRSIETRTSASNIILYDQNGDQVRAASGFAVSSSDSETAVITFRPQQLNEGETYTIVIPEGAVAIEGDNTRTSDEIVITYIGRADEPVAVEAISPTDSSEVAKIDNSSNPVIVQFDAYVATTDSASSTLYRIDEDGYTKISDLNILTYSNRIAIYPTSTQYLYLGQTYQVILEAGSVTDLSGVGGNEELVITYTGTYERTLSTDDETLFSDDFSDPSTSLNNFMRYEGDKNEPTEAMQDWGFDAESYPWSFYIRESTSSSDYCAASHSMYDPAGQSDDWMVIPQLEIPDEYCTLTFKAQSYLTSASDTLWVYVWPSETNYTAMTSSVIEQIRTEGTLVVKEILDPGSEEEYLADDWQEFTVDLAQWADQYIYIAFANLNYDESAVFVDDIEVSRSLRYLISLTNESSVVNKDSITISGKFTNNSDTDTYDYVLLSLIDEEGDTISTASNDSVAMEKDDYFYFTFSPALPLTIGETNKFTIGVYIDGYEDEVSSTIKDLTFTPTKRVIVEEMTGITCGNCPLGILAIELLEETYGDQFIPISIHTYTGDPYGSGLSDYTDHLGLNSAPSGVVNRNGVTSYPMEQDPATAEYIFTNGVDLWYDYVTEEFETPADIDVEASVTYDESAGTFSVPITVTSAVTLKSQSLSVFVVLMEDSIVTYQENYFSSVEDDNLGDWGKGGKYASSIAYNVTHNDVVLGCYGSSYDGASGLLPSTLTAGETYTIEDFADLDIPSSVADASHAKVAVIIIDGNTDTAVNSAVAKFNGQTSGISSIVNKADSNVAVGFYTLSGMKLSSLNGYHGPVIVKSVSDGKASAKTIIIR